VAGVHGVAVSGRGAAGGLVGALAVISGAPPPNPHQPALANLRTSQPLKTATRA